MPRNPRTTRENGREHAIYTRVSARHYRLLERLQARLGAVQRPCPLRRVTQARALEWALEHCPAPESVECPIC